MNTSNRLYRTTLPLTFLALAASLAPATAAPAPTSRPVPTTLPTTDDWARLAPHPRLLANAAKFTELKSATDVVSVTLRTAVLASADRNLNAEPITYPATGFLMGPMRGVQGRVLSLAMAFRLTGDRRYFVKAREELLIIADLPEWRPSHFLGIGEACIAAGVGLDWLHDELSEDDRTRITQAIIRNAITPYFEVTEGPQSWLRGDFNWTQVCNGGLIVAALAIAEREPDLARKVVDRAISNLDRVGATYYPDGSHAEGPGYWSYGTGFHVILADALRSALGSTFGTEQFPGFLGTADFANQVVGPSGRGYNYSDSGDENPAEDPIMIWFARERKDRSVANTKLASIERMRLWTATNKDPNARKPFSTSRHLPFELLWWDPSLPDTHATPPLHWTANGTAPLGIMRSSWGDPNASFLAIKGGTPNHSHGHMDAGGFILEADGVRWAIELGGENYNKMREAKLDLWNYTQDSNRWTTFRPGPDAHNILRFDNARQDITGHADISPLPTTDGTLGNTLDLSSLYPAHTTQVRRTVKLHPDRSMSLLDEWTTRDTSVIASFQWLTRATVTRTPTGVRLTQSDKHLDLLFTLPDGGTVNIEDVSAPRALQDSPNPGVSRIVIALPAPANTAGSLSIRIVPGSVNP